MNSVRGVKKHLKIGLPHTNYRGVAEHLLFMFAGQFQWDIISEKLGCDLSKLRTKNGDEIYATFFSVEVEFSYKQPLSSFKLDDNLIFLYELSAYKNLIVDGKIIFGLAGDIEKAEAAGLDSNLYDNRFLDGFPRMRMSNILITPKMGNDKLKIAPPAGVSFDAFSQLNQRDEILSISNYVQKHNKIKYFDSPCWEAVFGSDTNCYDYAVFAERDTNGAGLVYFANYIVFVKYAESAIQNKISGLFSRDIKNAQTSKLHIVYLGNVSCEDGLEIKTECFKNNSNGRLIGLRYFINRKSDKKLIAVCESVKSFI